MTVNNKRTGAKMRTIIKPIQKRRMGVRPFNKNRRFKRRVYPQRRKSNQPTNNNFNMGNRFRQLRVNAPVGLGYNVENRQNSTITITRTGFLTPVKASVTYQISAFNMHPNLLPWVKTLSTLYDKYKFLSLSIRYMGQCPSSFSGSAFIAFDYDPHVKLSENTWRTQAYDKYVTCPIWSTSSWVSVTKNILNDKWYDTNISEEDDKDSWHDKHPGRIICGSEGGMNNQGITVGQVEILYTIMLSRPTFVGSEIAPSPDVTFTSNLVNLPDQNGGLESIPEDFENV